MSVHDEVQAHAEGRARAPAVGAAQKPNTRARILDAALSLAKESGIRHLSLDAIARHAGVSKGGLLYHFPTKNQLMQALVLHHLDTTDAVIDEAVTHARSPNAVASALLALQRQSGHCERAETPDGVVAAFVEDPLLLGPIRAHHQRLVERIRLSAADRDMSLIVFLALEGMKAHDLFDLRYLTSADRLRVLDTLNACLLGNR